MKEPWKDGSPVPEEPIDISDWDFSRVRFEAGDDADPEQVAIAEAAMTRIRVCDLALALLVEARDSGISDDWQERVREFLEEVGE